MTFGWISGTGPVVQSKIARRLALAVNTKLNDERLNRLADREFPNRSVFENWILAQSLIFGWKQEALDQARELLNGVVRSFRNTDPHIRLWRSRSICDISILLEHFDSKSIWSAG